MTRKIYVRASIGTLAKLGLLDLKYSESPTTAYLLQYSPIGCSGGCRFCLQSRRALSRSSDKLGRVTWPTVDLETLASSWKSVFTRVCLQTIIKPGFHLEALEILRFIRTFECVKPLSLATTPVPREILEEARKLGVDSLGVGLDVATKGIFEKWGKPYSWDLYWLFIKRGVEVYGAGNVYVHLIAGLGESLRELVYTMRRIYELGGRVALFNYTNEKGASPVSIQYYRLAQIARLLLEQGLNPDEYIDYEHLKTVRDIPVDKLEEAFYTSGCPGCNRPFYNESPRGPVYNIPSRQILNAYIERLREELRSIGVHL